MYIHIKLKMCMHVILTIHVVDTIEAHDERISLDKLLPVCNIHIKLW